MPEVDRPRYEVVKYTPEKGYFTETVYLDGVLAPTDIWTVGKSKIIGLTGLQRIADKEGIVEKKFEHAISPTKGNKQQHAVNIWVGFVGDANPDNFRRGSGEASELNTGAIIVDKDGTRKYDAYAKIDSKYKYAMADKRAFSRAVLKLIKLYGVYSDVEAQDFEKPSDIDY